MITDPTNDHVKIYQGQVQTFQPVNFVFEDQNISL